MTKSTVASLEAKLAALEATSEAAVNALEARCARLEAKLVALVQRTAAAFDELQPVVDTHHQATRVARGAWDSALASLRAEHGAPDAGFPREQVLKRAAELAAH